ncbi:cytochrome P450 4c3-like [Uranotaenia lowii]|uniref:cytochrome P450 4c3-like n=1 Tax=Uranotaenia lowii TaxID=190385 RepID=UPI00247AD555|nr:cytochrome P450 4c3-like [Uranotaenia lowii]
MLALVLLGTLALIAIVKVVQWRRQLQLPFKKVPGPPGLPLLGNTLDIVSKESADIFRLLIELEKDYGKLFKVDIMTGIWLFYSSAETVERIMTGPEFNCKSDDYDMLVEWLGTGLLISNGNKWFTHRKALTPAFHFKILENYVQVFDDKSTILAKKFLKSSGQPVKIFPMVKLCTLDVIVESAMGSHSDAQSKESVYTTTVEEISSIIFWRMFHVVYNQPFFFRFSKHYKPYQKYLRTIHDYTLSIIEQRRAALKQQTVLGKESSPRVNDVGTKSKKALLDVLLETQIDGRLLTNEEIREEVDTFMFAGHDTTASAITFILYSLGKYPDIQQKVYNEIVSVIGEDKSTPVTLSTLNDLRYLELVIKESLRMFPPVPFISRNTLKEVQLGGVLIPPNNNITIGIYNMHHNPEYFPEPERFLPERFEAERGVEKMNPYAYVPFSAGGRNCIGQKFAMLELKSTISKVLRWCRIELTDPAYEPPLKAEMILKPSDEMPLKFYPRN